MKPIRFFLLVMALCLTIPNAVFAVPGVDDYPYANDTPNADDPTGFAKRNCTSFVSWRIRDENGFKDFKNSMGGTKLSNAGLWGSRAEDMGYKVDASPSPGSVAWWNNDALGHVAWVRTVGNGTIEIEEYNVPNGSFTYNSRVVSSSSPSGYIHFKDLPRFAGGGNTSTRGVQRLDAFIRGTNTTGNNTYRNIKDNSPWGTWVPLENSGSSNITSQPASISRNADRIDMFARDVNGMLIHKWYDASSGWGSWVSKNVCISSAPTVTSWHSKRLDVFARGCNPSGNNLVHVWMDSYGWWVETVPDHSGYRIASSPTATAWSDGRIDIFARAENGNYIHKWYDSYGWGSWVSKADCILGDPAVSSWGKRRLDVFVVACGVSGNNVGHNWYDGSNWWWEFLPGGDNVSVTNLLGASSWGPFRIDILARGQNGEPLHKSYNWGWSQWANLGGGVAN